MDFMEISKKRITVRKFEPTPVEPEKIKKILEAGRWSPTAVNGQPQRILVLNTPEKLAKVREFFPLAMIKNMLTWLKNAMISKTEKSTFIMVRRWFCLFAMIPDHPGSIPKMERTVAPLMRP